MIGLTGSKAQQGEHTRPFENFHGGTGGTIGKMRAMAVQDKMRQRGRSVFLLFILGLLPVIAASADRSGAAARGPHPPAIRQPFAQCPPGQVAYRDGTEPGTVKCVPATPRAQCPPGQVAYRDGTEPGTVKCVPMRR